MNRAPGLPGHTRFGNPRAELMRLRALYRDATLRGAVKITHEDVFRSVRALVGPDCGYHLYRCVPVRKR